MTELDKVSIGLFVTRIHLMAITRVMHERGLVSIEELTRHIELTVQAATRADVRMPQIDQARAAAAELVDWLRAVAEQIPQPSRN